MGKLTKEELAARRKRMQEEALKSVAKREQLNIRIDGESIIRLYAMADKQKKPVGTMVREWILDRLCGEENPARIEPLQILINMMQDLHKKIDSQNRERLKSNSKKRDSKSLYKRVKDLK